jgi:tetratricopeptide (TPR) repeat protein
VERRGLATAYQARVLRQLGEPGLAKERYDAVIELGEAYTRPGLIARGIVGLGLLAQARGNLPDARQYFNRALRIQEAASDTRRVAHQGLMICAGSAGDLSTAARHAWAAYVDADGASRAETLIDLSEMLLRAGSERAALSGFASAVRASVLPRFEIPALGGLAIAAARGATGELATSLVRGADRRLDAITRSGSLPYLQACALAEVADAFSELGDIEAAGARRQRARELAVRHGFHEVLFRLESANSEDARRAAQAAREASVPWEIVQAVEAITSVEGLAETALELCEA